MLYKILELKTSKLLLFIFSIRLFWLLSFTIVLIMLVHNNIINTENNTIPERNYWYSLLLAPVIESIAICMIYNISRLVSGSTAISIVIVTLAFPLVHLSNSLGNFIYTIPSGLTYALLFEHFRMRTNSLNATIAITAFHSLHNLLAPNIARIFIQLISVIIPV